MFYVSGTVGLARSLPRQPNKRLHIHENQDHIGFESACVLSLIAVWTLFKQKQIEE